MKDGERRRKERVRKREGKAEEEESKISMSSLKEGMEISIFRGSDKLWEVGVWTELSLREGVLCARVQRRVTEGGKLVGGGESDGEMLHSGESGGRGEEEEREEGAELHVVRLGLGREWVGRSVSWWERTEWVLIGKKRMTGSVKKRGRTLVGPWLTGEAIRLSKQRWIIGSTETESVRSR
jgi:hypothetical protein